MNVPWNITVSFKCLMLLWLRHTVRVTGSGRNEKQRPCATNEQILTFINFMVSNKMATVKFLWCPAWWPNIDLHVKLVLLRKKKTLKKVKYLLLIFFYVKMQHSFRVFCWLTSFVHYKINHMNLTNQTGHQACRKQHTHTHTHIHTHRGR